MSHPDGPPEFCSTGELSMACSFWILQAVRRQFSKRYSAQKLSINATTLFCGPTIATIWSCAEIGE